MTKQIAVIFFGVVLATGAAPAMSGAARPGTAQSSSTTSKKKRSTSTSKSTSSSRSNSSKSKKKNVKTKGQQAPTADRIKEIQAALQKDGSYQGEPTGKWDESTSDAMRRYQDKNGFPATGKIDALSLNKLGLGSDTAGKGAPTVGTKPAPTPISVPKQAPTSAPAPAATSAPPEAQQNQ